MTVNNSMTISKFGATVLILALMLAVLAPIVSAPFQYCYENSFDLRGFTQGLRGLKLYLF